MTSTRLGKHCFPDRSLHKRNSLLGKMTFFPSLIEENAFLPISLLFKKHWCLCQCTFLPLNPKAVIFPDKTKEHTDIHVYQIYVMSKPVFAFSVAVWLISGSFQDLVRYLNPCNRNFCLLYSPPHSYKMASIVTIKYLNNLNVNTCKLGYQSMLYFIYDITWMYLT